MPTTLSSKQRQYLKGLAHDKDPVVRVGKAGLSHGVVAETEASLKAHELVKVRIDGDDGAGRKALASQLAESSGAALVGTIGKVAILYRPRAEEPTIVLPKA
jgi:RNA-binding protein